MPLYCPTHAPWDKHALATVPVSCPGCKIENLRAEVERLKASTSGLSDAAALCQRNMETAEARVVAMEAVLVQADKLAQRLDINLPLSEFHKEYQASRASLNDRSRDE
jgi:hypothetical protein